MACSLQKMGPRRFKAEVGSQVTLEVNGPTDAGAKLISIKYDEIHQDIEPPFQFNVKVDMRLLVVIVSATKPGAKLKLVETCNKGSSQVLYSYKYNPAKDPRILYITGV